MQSLLFDKEFFTVGEVSRLCHVPIQTLHYYNKEGILIPSKVDEYTKYRYYSKENIIELFLIKELRDVEFSIEEIRQTKDIKVLTEKLEKKIEQLDEKIKKFTYKKDKTTGILNVLKEGKRLEESIPIIQERRYEKKYVIATRKMSSCTKEGFIERYGELLRIAEQYDLYITGELIVKLYGKMYCIDPDSVDMEVSMTVLKSEKDCPIIKQEADYRGISKIYQGPYEEIRQGYVGMLEYAQEKGYSISDYFVFRYLINMAYTKECDTYITEIILPIKN